MQVRTFYEGVRIAGGIGPYEGVGSLPPGFWFEGRGDRMLVAGSLTDDAPLSPGSRLRSRDRR